jgi:hypothetical protein
MSYDISIVKNGEVVKLPFKHNIKGGTFVSGGTDELWINVTYNYAPILEKVLPGGIKYLHGKNIRETYQPLVDAMCSLTSSLDSTDYWECNENNVREALKNILMLSMVCDDKDATWEVE